MPKHPGGGPGKRNGTMATGKPKDTSKTVKRLMHYVGVYKIHFALVFLCLIISTIASSVGTYLLSPILNKIADAEIQNNDFASKAIEKGAAVVICDHDIGIKNSVIVENTRKAYALMCANYYGNCHREMKMIGVTGTNGKTTTTFIIKKILEENGYKVGVIGTVEVVIGNEKYPADYTTPDPAGLHKYLYMMKMAGCDVCIMETSSQALVQLRTY